MNDINRLKHEVMVKLDLTEDELEFLINCIILVLSPDELMERELPGILELQKMNDEFFATQKDYKKLDLIRITPAFIKNLKQLNMINQQLLVRYKVALDMKSNQQ